MVHDKFLLRLGAWSGLLWIATFGLGWLVLARFMPPVDPGASAHEVAQRLAEHHWEISIASVAMMVSIVWLLPLSALVVLLMARIERGVGMLTLMMAFSSVTGIVVTFYTGLSFVGAAFRPERPDEIVRALTDLGFLQFMGGIPMFLPIWGLLAYAILVTQRRTGQELFPRYVGYVSLLVVLLYLPELLVFLLKTGPFAWDGVVGFWIPAVLLIGYLFLSPIVLRRVVAETFGDE